MNFFRFDLLAAVVLAASAAVHPVTASAQGCDADCLSVEDARADLQVAYDTLQLEHVDLLARRSQADYAAHLDALQARIDEPIARREFHLILHELMAYGNIGHAKTEAGISDVIASV